MTRGTKVYQEWPTVPGTDDDIVGSNVAMQVIRRVNESEPSKNWPEYSEHLVFLRRPPKISQELIEISAFFVAGHHVGRAVRTKRLKDGDYVFMGAELCKRPPFVDELLRRPFEIGCGIQVSQRYTMSSRVALHDSSRKVLFDKNLTFDLGIVSEIADSESARSQELPD